MNINNRIAKIIEHFRLSSSEFADEIDVPRSSISHITSGRNKPSLDFITKVKGRFPSLQWDWLINGEGEMLINEKDSQKNISPSDLFSIIDDENYGKEELSTMPTEISDKSKNISPSKPISQEFPIPIQDVEKKNISDSQPLEISPKKEENPSPLAMEQSKKEESKIKKIILLYENGKFESFEP